MTRDEARDRFSAAFDRDLSGAEKDAFEALLEADSELAAEYSAFCEMLGGAVSALRVDASPDLLPRVQKKLRDRSGGKFYRDRFSESTKLGAFTTTVVVMVLVIFLAWAVAILNGYTSGF